MGKHSELPVNERREAILILLGSSRQPSITAISH
jgi:hypothetical protein